MTTHHRKPSQIQQQVSTPFRNITGAAVNGQQRKRNQPTLQLNNENINTQGQQSTFSSVASQHQMSSSSKQSLNQNAVHNYNNNNSAFRNFGNITPVSSSSKHFNLMNGNTNESKLKINTSSILDTEYQKTISMLEDQLRIKDKTISDLNFNVQEAKLEIELKSNQNADLQKWLSLMTQSLQQQLQNNGQEALSGTSENFTAEGLITKINQGLQTIDNLRVENFNLKKQIAFDKKHYVDLKNAYFQVRKEFKQKEQDLFLRHPDLKEILGEKQNLQNTLKVLTEEVEFLSKKNEGFLKELKHKNFYDAYKRQSEELTKLREAHALLINLIQTKDIAITKSSQSKTPNGASIGNAHSFGSLLSGQSPMSNNHILNSLERQTIPLRRLLSCKNSTSNYTAHSQLAHGSKCNKDSFVLTDENDSSSLGGGLQFGNEDYEAMESVQVQDINQYLEAVLSRYKGSYGGSGINFLDQSAKNSNGNDY
eukprot:403375531